MPIPMEVKADSSLISQTVATLNPILDYVSQTGPQTSKHPPPKKGHPLKTWHPKTWHLQHLQGSAVLDLSVTTLSEVHSMSKTM